MSDFFREVDEELRNDRMKAIWKKYGVFFIAVVVIIVAGTAAYRFYLGYEESQAGASGDRYLKALELIDEGKRDEGQKILAELEKDGWASYPALAKFRSTSMLLGEGKKEEALKAFDELASSSITADLKDYARLQAAMISVDIEAYEKVIERTKPLIGEGKPWNYFALEARALAAWKAEKLDEVGEIVKDVKTVSNIPQGLRQRMQMLEELLIARGGSLPTE